MDVSDFELEVIERSRHTPVLVDFWAPWCGPCKMLGPTLDRLADEAGGRWVLAKVNTDAQPELAQRFGIRGIPNVKLFRGGKVIAEFTGALPEPSLRQWLAEHLPTPKRDTMARARELLRAGRSVEATALLRPLLQSEPSDVELAALTARALVFVDPAAAVELVAKIPASSPWADGAELVRQLAAGLLAEHDAADRLTDTPLRQRYLSALVQLRRESFDTALGTLIEVLLEKPHYDDDRAKALATAVFKHLGPRHPIAEKHSRTYAMAVNV
jgi:putative thioredoxin